VGCGAGEAAEHLVCRWAFARHGTEELARLQVGAQPVPQPWLAGHVGIDEYQPLAAGRSRAEIARAADVEAAVRLARAHHFRNRDIGLDPVAGLLRAVVVDDD